MSQRSGEPSAAEKFPLVGVRTRKRRVSSRRRRRIQMAYCHKRTTDIDVLVQEVRSSRYNQIQNQCGTIRLLGISQPVEITDMYTDVNFWEDTSLQWQNVSSVVQSNSESNNIDQLVSSKVIRNRVPGLNTVLQYSKLKVLGKSGAGKTTFLQWVAIKCNQGEFQSHRVPIFIRLKNFALKTKRKNSEDRLLNYIKEEFLHCGIADKWVIETILLQGRGLILLDGLDEVAEDDNEVVNDITRFVNKYLQNQYIITSRLTTRKYKFNCENFVDVEIADFQQEQVEAFPNKFFLVVHHNDREQGKILAQRFQQQLLEMPSNEMTETPLLLNLTCLFFSLKGKIPSKGFQLYEQGLDVLLSLWDEEKTISGDELYRNLSGEQKIYLLSQIAASNIDNNLYLFAKSEVEECIANYLCSLPYSSASTHSKAVLKSLEAQHGLFVESTPGFYSFAHVTFQEYFTALWVIHSFASEELKQSVMRMNLKSWREVFVLTTKMMQPADELLLLMKRKIDALLGLDEKLQQLLFWVTKHSYSTQLVYKPIDCSSFRAIILRAFYLELILDLELPLGLTREHNFISQVFAPSTTVALDFACTRDLNRAFARVIICAHSDLSTVFFEMDILLHLVRDRNAELKQSLQKLKQQLPDPDFNCLMFHQWWRVHGKNWTQEFRAVMIQYWHVGDDWQLSEQQKESLHQYYNANKLLVDCLHSGCEVSAEVRQQIEDTLLLPISELEQSVAVGRVC
ncbi:NACHT domain-containing NTPase [Iningainema tapete]|uniref:NACHT domain-containing protein n=1 Tax=Iningainema tapete TaxID=2806730 RepID=UPI0030803E20